MNFAEGAQTVSSFKFAGRGQQETWVGDLRTTLLVVLRLRSRVQQVLEDFSAVSQTVRICRRTPAPWPTCAPPCSRSPRPRHLPGIEALPSPRQGEFFPAKKMSRLSSRPTTLKNNFQLSCGGTTVKKKSSCPVGGQLSKVSANLPGRAAPARRHGGTQLMSRTNYEAVADFAGHWLHRAQVSLLTGKIGQIKLSHIRKKNLVRAWRGPAAGLVRAWCGPGAGLVRAWCGPAVGLVRAWRGPGAGLVRAWCGPGAGSKTEAAEPASLARSPTDCDTCGNLRRRGVGVTPTSGDAYEGGMPRRTCEGALRKYNTPAL